VIEMIIREARPDDVEAMKELWKEFIDYHKANDRFFSRTPDGHERFGEFALDNIRSEDWLVLVAVVNNQVVGHCMAAIHTYPPVYENTRYGYIQDIAVTEKYRRENIGSRLFEHAVGWFKNKKVSRIELDAASTNEVSQSFWRKTGFRDYMIRMAKDI
jgi:ribosomal protein S18 acetylase RimI-like enzyme